MYLRRQTICCSGLAVAASLAWAERVRGQVSLGGAELVSWIWVAIGAVALATVLGAVLLWRRQEAEESDAARVPPLLFPAAPAGRPRGMRPAQRSKPGAAAPVMPVRPGPGQAPPMPQRAARPQPVAAGSVPAEPLRRTVSESVVAPPPAAGAGESLVDGTTIRFHKPVDGTLQILPGRLEVVEGADTGQSIRFIRVAGEPEVTFGRSDGPPYRHIQLLAPTVSRRHARMRFDDAGWTIRNLSATNPVIVNGEELELEGEPRILEEGDRIEMGEVSFVFRER